MITAPITPELRGTDADREPDFDVQHALAKNEKGKVLGTLLNVVHVLSNDDRWKGRIRWSSFDGVVEIDRAALRDTDITRLALWLDEVYGLRVSTDNLHRAVEFVAAQDPFHKVCEWMGRETWDGVPRVDGFLAVYAAAEDTRLHRKFSSSFLIGACARVFQPGCQLDTILMLLGRQGAGKSRLCAALAPTTAWFGESTFDIGNKDALQVLDGKWFYELAECESLNRASASASKSYITNRTDRYRRPYARLPEDHPRTTVFIATGNEIEVLRDPTGARRFWPVFVGEPDLAALARDRAQLFAEALVRYRAGETWWLDADEEKLLVAAQRQFTVPEAWAPVIRPWVIEQKHPFSVEDVLLHCLGIPPQRWDEKGRQRVGRALAYLGCEKTRPELADGSRPWCWRWPGAAKPEESHALAS